MIKKFAFKFARNIYGTGTKFGYIPRRPFAHYYSKGNGFHSRLHVQNFYTSFWPDSVEKAKVSVNFYNKDGDIQKVMKMEVEPFGQMYLDVDDALAEFEKVEGMVTVDVKPPKSVKSQFKFVPKPDQIEIRSPFWMSYHDNYENYMYVHSISYLEGEIKGGVPLINYFLKKAKPIRNDWKSWRLLDVALLENLEVVVMNHSIKNGTSRMYLLSDSDEVVWSQQLTVSPRGMQRISIPKNVIEGLKDNKDVNHIRIGLNPILSANGKPYVLLKYSHGPTSLHHG